MPVRLHAEWLTQTDERILETLAETGAVPRAELQATLAELSPLLALSDYEFESRCRKLAARGLLARNGDLVSLSTRGQSYLAGDVQLADREDATPGRGSGASTGDGYWICPDCGATGIDGRNDCPVCGDESQRVD